MASWMKIGILMDAGVDGNEVGGLECFGCVMEGEAEQSRQRERGAANTTHTHRAALREVSLV